MANIVTGLARLEITLISDDIAKNTLISDKHWLISSNIGRNVVPFNVTITVRVNKIGPSLKDHGHGVDTWVEFCNYTVMDWSRSLSSILGRGSAKF